MCAELVDSLHKHTSMWEGHEIDLVARARDLMAEPVAEGPTDEEMDELFTEIDQSGEALSWRLYARAVLDRWGTPNLAQVRSSLGDGSAVSDEELMELMPQQMRNDLAAAASALACGLAITGFERDSPKAAGVCRLILNRHAVDHARAALAKWGHQ